ncbi:hypothetical protein D3C78_1373760 [compost metagenome]
MKGTRIEANAQRVTALPPPARLQKEVANTSWLYRLLLLLPSWVPPCSALLSGWYRPTSGITIRCSLTAHSAYRLNSWPSVLPRLRSMVSKLNASRPMFRFSSGDTLSSTFWTRVLLLNGPA